MHKASYSSMLKGTTLQIAVKKTSLKITMRTANINDGQVPNSNLRAIQFLKPDVLEPCTGTSSASKYITPRQIKTRTGCVQCKKRKIKCDEAAPSCKRCLMRKQTCYWKPPTSRWHGRTMTFQRSEQPCDDVTLSPRDDPVLTYWFESGCRVMTIEPITSNPFSFPLRERLSESESLLHLVRSLSMADLANYEVSQMTQSFEERGLALVALQKEIKHKSVPCGLMLLSTLFLGISAPWISGNPSDFGIVHLFAISAMINKAFANGVGLTDNMFYLAIGLYIYWDMACSFLTHFNRALPLREELFQIAINLSTKGLSHPVTGIATHLIYILGKIGRYQRQVLDTNLRNLDQENLLETQLTDWKMPAAEPQLQQIAECYRLTGFIMLYSTKNDEVYNNRISAYAEKVVDMLNDLPTTSPRANFQGVLLMLAGSEISDPIRRDVVLSKFKALHQTKKVKVTLHGEQLVKEVWALRDKGIRRCAVGVMKDRGWHLMLG